MKRHFLGYLVKIDMSNHCSCLFKKNVGPFVYIRKAHVVKWTSARPSSRRSIGSIYATNQTFLAPLLRRPSTPCRAFHLLPGHPPPSGPSTYCPAFHPLPGLPPPSVQLQRVFWRVIFITNSVKVHNLINKTQQIGLSTSTVSQIYRERIFFFN